MLDKRIKTETGTSWILVVHREGPSSTFLNRQHVGSKTSDPSPLRPKRPKQNTLRRAIFDLLTNTLYQDYHQSPPLQPQSISMVQQNLTLCFLMSALAGFFTISARAVVLKQVEREKKGLSANSIYEKHISSILFFLLEGSAHVLSFIGPWFGPASLILPACGSSKLLFNVLIVGAILQHENFDKKALVGTAIVASGVIYLPIVGPRPQENQDLIDLIVKDPVSLIWLGTAVVGYMISVGIMLCCDLKKFTPHTAETIRLLVSTFSTLGNTVSKASSLAAEDGGIYRGLLLGIGFSLP
jgi:hypothetical protein